MPGRKRRKNIRKKTNPKKTLGSAAAAAPTASTAAEGDQLTGKDNHAVGSFQFQAQRFRNYLRAYEAEIAKGSPNFSAAVAYFLEGVNAIKTLIPLIKEAGSQFHEFWPEPVLKQQVRFLNALLKGTEETLTTLQKWVSGLEKASQKNPEIKAQLLKAEVIIHFSKNKEVAIELQCMGFHFETVVRFLFFININSGKFTAENKRQRRLYTLRYEIFRQGIGLELDHYVKENYESHERLFVMPKLISTQHDKGAEYTIAIYHSTIFIAAMPKGPCFIPKDHEELRAVNSYDIVTSIIYCNYMSLLEVLMAEGILRRDLFVNRQGNPTESGIYYASFAIQESLSVQLYSFKHKFDKFFSHFPKQVFEEVKQAHSEGRISQYEVNISSTYNLLSGLCNYGDFLDISRCPALVDPKKEPFEFKRSIIETHWLAALTASSSTPTLVISDSEDEPSPETRETDSMREYIKQYLTVFLNDIRCRGLLAFSQSPPVIPLTQENSRHNRFSDVGFFGSENLNYLRDCAILIAYAQWSEEIINNCKKVITYCDAPSHSPLRLQVLRECKRRIYPLSLSVRLAYHLVQRKLGHAFKEDTEGNYRPNFEATDTDEATENCSNACALELATINLRALCAQAQQLTTEIRSLLPSKQGSHHVNYYGNICRLLFSQVANPTAPLSGRETKLTTLIDEINASQPETPLQTLPEAADTVAVYKTALLCLTAQQPDAKPLPEHIENLFNGRNELSSPPSVPDAPPVYEFSEPPAPAAPKPNTDDSDVRDLSTLTPEPSPTDPSATIVNDRTHPLLENFSRFAPLSPSHKPLYLSGFGAFMVLADSYRLLPPQCLVRYFSEFHGDFDLLTNELHYMALAQETRVHFREGAHDISLHRARFLALHVRAVIEIDLLAFPEELNPLEYKDNPQHSITSLDTVVLSLHAKGGFQIVRGNINDLQQCLSKKIIDLHNIDTWHNLCSALRSETVAEKKQTLQGHLSAMILKMFYGLVRFNRLVGGFSFSADFIAFCKIPQTRTLIIEAIAHFPQPRKEAFFRKIFTLPRDCTAEILAYLADMEFLYPLLYHADDTRNANGHATVIVNALSSSHWTWHNLHQNTLLRQAFDASVAAGPYLFIDNFLFAVIKRYGHLQQHFQRQQPLDQASKTCDQYQKTLFAEIAGNVVTIKRKIKEAQVIHQLKTHYQERYPLVEEPANTPQDIAKKWRDATLAEAMYDLTDALSHHSTPQSLPTMSVCGIIKRQHALTLCDTKASIRDSGTITQRLMLFYCNVNGQRAHFLGVIERETDSDHGPTEFLLRLAEPCFTALQAMNALSHGTEFAYVPSRTLLKPLVYKLRACETDLLSSPTLSPLLARLFASANQAPSGDLLPLLEHSQQLPQLDETSSLNPQQQHVTRAIQKSTIDTMNVVIGPPGTGKTYTTAWGIHALLQRGCAPEQLIPAQVLLTGSANQAVYALTKSTLSRLRESRHFFSIAVRLDRAKLTEPCSIPLLAQLRDYPQETLNNIRERLNAGDINPEEAIKEIQALIHMIHRVLRPFSVPLAGTLYNLVYNLTLPRINPNAAFDNAISKLQDTMYSLPARYLRYTLLKTAQIVACTLSAVGNPLLTTVFLNNVVHTIIEESSRTLPAEALPAILVTSLGLTILGDLYQLPPVAPNALVRTGNAHSVLKLLMGQASLYSLTTTYRPKAVEIGELWSTLFYGGLVKIHSAEASERTTPVIGPHPITVLDTARVTSTSQRSRTNMTNPVEARFTLQLAIRLANEHPELTVALLSAYQEQISLLKRQSPTPAPSNLTISSVDGFQGREADIIVISAVQQNRQGDIGFLMSPERANVMLSRAIYRLYLVIDIATFQTFIKKLACEIVRNQEAISKGKGKRKKSGAYFIAPENDSTQIECSIRDQASMPTCDLVLRPCENDENAIKVMSAANNKRPFSAFTLEMPFSQLDSAIRDGDLTALQPLRNKIIRNCEQRSIVACGLFWNAILEYHTQSASTAAQSRDAVALRL